MEKKIGCFMYAKGAFFERLFECSFKSFKKWHPDIPVIGFKVGNITPDIEIFESEEEIFMEQEFNNIPSMGIKKFAMASRAMKENNLDKIIVLGSDTITCGVLDEFIDDNSVDILTSLDYPYPLISDAFNGIGTDHLNADVVCFNSVEAIDYIVQRSLDHGHWVEQGGLNEVAHTSKYTNKTVDSPYSESKVVYNVRSKGNVVADPMTQSSYTSKFIVRDSKLFVPTPTLNNKEKQIKVWHYCEGFFSLDESAQKIRMDYWINKGFNEETKKFFKYKCGCGDFFDGEFIL
tara:strand:+ start:11121 stop:11990 length:870 start_codon:yes stop_codon:yes gene_type:complete